MSKNEELANLFFEIADLLELEGVDWKPNAYRKAARSLESLSEPVEQVFRKGGIKALMEIQGVGQGLADKIVEFLKSGRIKEFDKLVKSVPRGVEELMHVPSLGPKKVMRLYKELKIRSPAELEVAAKSGRLRRLAGFGVKSEQDILRGLGIVKQGVKRKLLGVALPLARELSERLEKVDGVKRVVPSGSLRRMRESVGDIDLLVISSKPSKVMDVFTKLPEVQSILAKGLTRSSVVLKDGLQADVRVLDERSFGAGLQYFTGSKEHNVALRQIAIKKGFKLSEYGLFKNDRFVCGRSESEIYNKLGLRYIEPELRENQGEIVASQKNALPKLVTVNDIKGDLHLHSKWSDGVNSVEQMVSSAQKLGYKYVAITDHSKSERVANGMDEKRLVQYIRELDKLQSKFNIRILKGCEVDILPDGSLDFSDKYLKELDFVLGAVHSRFKSSKTDMTKRILRAFDNRYINAFAHPSGRIIHQRDAYEFDFEKVAEKANVRGIALEVDGHPARLDLKDSNVRIAVGLGCKLSISTDSHSVDGLRFMELGVAQARRGWAEAKDVINSWSFSKLQKFLRR